MCTDPIGSDGYCDRGEIKKEEFPGPGTIRRGKGRLSLLAISFVAFLLVESSAVAGLPVRHRGGGWGGGWGWPSWWGPGWASTPQGDIYQGFGAAASGMGDWAIGNGYFLHELATVESMQTDTWIRLNEYLYLSQLNAARQRAERFRYEKEQRKLASVAIHTRIRFNPEEWDIENGDALNVLMHELSGPRVHRSALRIVTQELPTGTGRRIPLLLSRNGVMVAPARVLGECLWPSLLLEAKIARERSAYESAVKTALDQAARGRLSIAAIEGLDRAIVVLRQRFETDSPLAAQAERTTARRFLDGLVRSARMFHEPAAVEVMGFILRRPAENVADLIELMQRFRLQFAPAETADERTLYHQVYRLLLLQQQRMMHAASFAERDESPVASLSVNGRGDGR